MIHFKGRCWQRQFGQVSILSKINVFRSLSQPPTQSSQSISKPAIYFINPSFTVRITISHLPCLLPFHISPTFLCLRHNLSSLFPPSVCMCMCECVGMCHDHLGELAIKMIKKNSKLTSSFVLLHYREICHMISVPLEANSKFTRYCLIQYIRSRNIALL